MLKEDGTVCICGDYKLTINQASKVETYPIPQVEDLFSLLAGGKTFIKLDVNHAYQQLLLLRILSNMPTPTKCCCGCWITSCMEYPRWPCTLMTYWLWDKWKRTISVTWIRCLRGCRRQGFNWNEANVNLKHKVWLTWVIKYMPKASVQWQKQSGPSRMFPSRGMCLFLFSLYGKSPFARIIIH